MKFISLASGSKGNSSYVELGDMKFLIDIGITLKRLKNSLEPLNVVVDDIDFLLLTHTHSDHILGLSVLVKHSHFKIYMSEEMYPILKDIVPKERIVFYQDEMHIKDMKINLIHTSHDAPGSVGFLFTYQDHSLVYITDTGYLNRKYLKNLGNKELYYIESNHDEKMLMDGPYPYQTKQRIISDVGRLSNETTVSYLKTLIGEQTKYIVLSHLSETNNTKELAFSALEKVLENIPYQPEVLIAEQDVVGDLIEV